MLAEFKTRLGHKKEKDQVLLHVKKQAISIAINTYTVYTFDLTGRPLSVFQNEHTFRRGLSGRMMEKFSVGSNGDRQHIRRWLSVPQQRELMRAVLRRVHQIYRRALKDELQFSNPNTNNTADDVTHVLHRILAWDVPALERDAQRFSEIYRPIGILPPDLYLSLVLQATEGCSYNRCSYCSFYQEQPYRIKSDSEFRDHILAVKAYLGEALPLRKFLFLGEANALDLPQPKLLQVFQTIHDYFHFGETFPSMKGIYGFLTAFPKQRKTADDFAELGANHLRRVYIGMESGSDELLRFLKKPGTAEHTVRTVNAAKAGGVNVGVIVLLGAGGRRYSEAHIEQTANAIEAMNLGRHDIIFMSPLTHLNDTRYASDIQSHGIAPLTELEVSEQKTEIISQLNLKRRENAPKVALYNINDFIY